MTDPLILAIDTSCDDTSAAVTRGVTVFANVIASQTQLHKPYGGVFPTVAKQAHRENIDRVVETALYRAGLDEKNPTALEAIAVTQGPGLAPALEVGIRKAKELAETLSIPLIPVNHIEAHALSPLAEPKSAGSSALGSDWTALSAAVNRHSFPALSIIVSGGHTDFFLVRAIGEYERLGGTIDDAAGEALDKVGRMLGLGYPAGPIIEQMAKQGNPKRFAFPLPMTAQQNYDLSFSGMKTFSRNLVEELEQKNQLNKQGIYDFAASFQYAVIRHITYKLNKVLVDIPIREIWLGGGVAANMSLRRSLRETLAQHSRQTGNPKLLLHVPHTKRLCMDNAAMIGVVAGFNFQRGLRTKSTSKTGLKLAQIERLPRWQMGVPMLSN